MTDRLPIVKEREGLSPEAASTWDSIVSTRGGVRGPFAILMNSPAAAQRVADLGTYLRFESGLDARLRETAILATALTLDCAFEAASHRPIALEAGVSEADLELLLSGSIDDLPDDLRSIARFVTELFTKHRVSDSVFEAVRAQLGVRGATDLVATIGYYSMLACVLNATDSTPASR